MTEKYRKEWQKLIEMGREHGLVKEQLYFLMALRSIEGGSKNNEFNVKTVRNTSFDLQTKVTIESIKANDVRWQDYIRDQSYIDFPTFFMLLGGPLRDGWHSFKSMGRIDKLKQAIEEVRDEFE